MVALSSTYLAGANLRRGRKVFVFLLTAATEELQWEASVIKRVSFQPIVASQQGKEKAKYTNEYCTLRLDTEIDCKYLSKSKFQEGWRFKSSQLDLEH